MNIKLAASWLTNNLTHPVTVKVFSTNIAGRDKILVEKTITATDGSEITVAGLPQQAVVLVAYDVDGNELAATNVANPCTAGNINLTLAASPTANNAKITMQLYVRCPNRTNTVTVLPTFYLYYKENGTPARAYKLLGVVNQGYINTTLLNTSKRYDFKAIWGSTIKEVGNRAITIENLTTIGPNDNLGQSTGFNLQMLTEKCTELGY